MIAEVFDAVLPLTVGEIGWWRDDPGAGLPGVLEVAVDVGHAHHDGMGRPQGRRGRRTGDDDRTRATPELGTVIADAQPLDQAEPAAKPVRGS